MRHIIAILLSIILLCCVFAGCSKTSNEAKTESPLVLIDTIYDQYDNILNQIYYNTVTGDYYIKEYLYEFKNDKWVCTTQYTTVYENCYPTDYSYYADPYLNIYYDDALKDNSIIILNNEYIKISIIKALSSSSWFEAGYKLRIQNKTSDVLSVAFTEVFIMGIACEPVYNLEHVDPLATVDFDFVWDKATLDRCHVPYFGDVDFLVKVYNNDKWNAPALTGVRALIKK